MWSVDQPYSVTTEVKRSKFIAHLVPMEAYESFASRLKDQHPKASHIVTASRHLNGFDHIVEASSDDGEPKGSAGVPALNVLRGEEAINVSVLIVRYFGGIKLGTGGMARAYALAVKNLLDEVVKLPYEKRISWEFESSYAQVERILYQLKRLELCLDERRFEQRVWWHVSGAKASIEQLKASIKGA
jgi:uncharacterized YigZ family protein